MAEPFKDYGDFCLISFAVFGNYFALFGLHAARKAREALARGDIDAARKHARAARAWGLHGLWVSTPINIAILAVAAVFAWRLVKYLAAHPLF